jgi:flagellar biogenesis protein FliO
MDIVRQSLAITFVFVLLAAALWLLRKKGIRVGSGRPRGGRGVLELRGHLALSHQHTIHLVRVGQRDLVLALHPAGVTLLAELPPTPGSET